MQGQQGKRWERYDAPGPAGITHVARDGDEVLGHVSPVDRADRLEAAPSGLGVQVGADNSLAPAGEGDVRSVHGVAADHLEHAAVLLARGLEGLAPRLHVVEEALHGDASPWDSSCRTGLLELRDRGLLERAIVHRGARQSPRTSASRPST